MAHETSLNQVVARSSVIYPWKVVAGLSVCVFVTIGTSIYSFIFLSASLAEELRWSATQSGGLISAMWLVAPLALFAAPIIKRYGPWSLIVFGVLAQSLSLLAMAYSTQFTEWYALRILMGTGKVLLMVAAPVVIARYFKNNFGTALSVYWAVAYGAGVLMAPLTENLIRDMGWRGAAIVLSAISVASLPIAAMFFFSKRGAYIASDANEHMAVKIDEIAQSAGSDWKLLASSHGFRVLIITALAILGGGITTVALFSHINGLMKEAGFDSEFLGYVVGILSVTAVIGSLLIGWMMDNVRPFWSALSVSFIFITGLLLYFLMLQSPSKTLAIAGTASLGLSFAAGELMWINLLRRTVAPNLFSTAYGGWYFAVQVGYASGGAIVGMIIDRFHSIGLIVTMLLLYIPAMLMSVILALAIQKRDKFII